MHCPVCHNDDTKVIDSRIGSDGFSIRRRRECLACEYRFSTFEEVEILDLKVIKRDGRRQPYSRDKLLSGLTRSLLKRPFGEDDVKALVGRIERDIQRLRRDEVEASIIGDIVLGHLKELDQVAYIRFASVYKSFEDVDDFMKELKGLK